MTGSQGERLLRELDVIAGELEELEHALEQKRRRRDAVILAALRAQVSERTVAARARVARSWVYKVKHGAQGGQP